MCLTNIKNIDDIYYPRNWDNFHNKTNSILVENGPTREMNLNLVFQRFQKNRLCQYSNVKFLELIERIAELNFIIQDHAKHIHRYKTNVRSLRRKKTDVRCINFFVLLFFLSIVAFDIQCFGVLKFQSTSHVLFACNFNLKTHLYLIDFLYVQAVTQCSWYCF
jgi:hypothetical protein